MSHITHNNQGEIEMPTLLLQDKGFETIISISQAFEFTYKEYMNSANEISFTIYKELNGTKTPYWDTVVDHKIVYLKEYDERFDITVSLNEENATCKNVTGKALCESELSQVKLYNIEINTDNDMARSDYDENFPTILYRDQDITHYDWSDSSYGGKYENYTNVQKQAVLKNGSLLHRLLEKASNYKIGYVAETLQSLTRIASFTIDDKDIYSELTDEIGQEYGVLFTFDTVDGQRTVNAYDLYNTCSECGFRGEFDDKCPECDSTSFYGKYGTDTTVFVSSENLAMSLTKESDDSSFKNCFYVCGGDDDMNAAIINANPNGSSYIYYFAQDILNDMPANLVAKINQYNNLYDEYLTTHEYELNATTVANYNSVISEIKTYYPDSTYEIISSTVEGYNALSNLIYDTIDLQLYLNDGMLPTPEVNEESLDGSIALLTTANLSPVAIESSTTTAAQTTINNAVLGMVKALINTALYEPEVVDASYTKGTTGVWTGKIKLTTIADTDEYATTDAITIQVNNDVLTFVQQKITKKTASSDFEDSLGLLNMDTSIDDFKQKLHYYNLTSLSNLSTIIAECCNIILSEKTSMGDLYDSFYSKYFTRQQAITAESTARNIQLGYINDMNTVVSNLIGSTKTTLNFQSYLGNLWNTFISYRREDKYQNSNYISDGSNNAKLLSDAKELLATAQRELYKAATPQYSISTTMNNLMAIKEFEPLWDSFEVGNWIRVEVDGVIHKLRLLSYQIDMDNLSDISVEFSTVVSTTSGKSDVQSILDSAQSMSGSYSSVVNQVTKSSDATVKVNNWVDKGFEATTKIVDTLQEQNIVFDKTGISCKSFDDILNDYDPCQLKIIANGVYCTDDNWETVKAAIGKYIYTDPTTGEQKIAFGILADTIVGKQILSEKNIITNGNNSVIIDGNGITLDGGHITWLNSAPVTSVEVLYCLSDSATELVNPTEWSTAAPEWIKDKYVWQKTIWTDGNNQSSESNPTCISGADGQDGQTGTSVFSITPLYKLLDTKAQQEKPTSDTGWSTTPPTWDTGKYLHTCSKIVYKDPSSTVYTLPVCDSSWEAVNNIKIGGENLLSTSTELWTSGNINTSGEYATNAQWCVTKNALNVYDTQYMISNYTESTLQIVISSYDDTDAFLSQQTYFVVQGFSASVVLPDTTKKVRFSILNGNIEWSTYLSACKIKFEKGNKATDWSVPADDTAIAYTETQYYLSDSSEDLLNGTWSTTAPTWSYGKYVWKREIITYKTGAKLEGEPTYDALLTNSLNDFSGFKSDVQGVLSGGNPTTDIGTDYIITPKIGGGYLYIANENYNIQIDPNNIYTGVNALSGYIFSINNGSTPIMGVTNTGNGYFSGEIIAKSGSIGDFYLKNGSLYNDYIQVNKNKIIFKKGFGVYLGDSDVSNIQNYYGGLNINSDGQATLIFNHNNSVGESDGYMWLDSGKLTFYSNASKNSYGGTLTVKDLYVDNIYATNKTSYIFASGTKWNGDTIGAAYGGTGRATLTAGYVLVGNGTGAVALVNGTNANTGSTFVKRDASGNFNAGTITANLSGNATSATKATQDGDGNIISSTYFKLSGGTITGNLSVTGTSAFTGLASYSNGVFASGENKFLSGTFTDPLPNVACSVKISGLGAASRFSVGGYNKDNYALSTESFICNSWVRTIGNTGWFNETHGGGWYMTDSNYIRNYAKPVLLSKELYFASSTQFYINTSANARFNEATMAATTVSTSKSTGALKVAGGAGISGQMSADKVMVGDAVTLEYDSNSKCLNISFT